MKLYYIDEISRICGEFMQGCIKPDIEIKQAMLVYELKEKRDCYITNQNDGTMDVDYDDMCFTFHKVGGDFWVLCENATYYIMDKHKRIVKDTIDVEL